MKNLINSLNPGQQKELAILLKRDASANQNTASIIENHLAGNSAAYKQEFGTTELTDQEVDEILSNLM